MKFNGTNKSNKTVSVNLATYSNKATLKEFLNSLLKLQVTKKELENERTHVPDIAKNSLDNKYAATQTRIFI